jgi:hypothetical protein
MSGFLANALVGFFGTSVVPITGGYVSTATNTSSGTSFDFTSQAIGTAAAGRVVIVGIVNDSQTVSSVSIGGVSASLVKRQRDGTSANAELWSAVVATGTTATISIAFAGTTERPGIGVWAIYGASSSPSATAGASGNAPSTTISVPAGGFAVGCIMHNTGGSSTFSWSGLTENYDAVIASSNSHSGASSLFTAAQAPLSVTCTQSGGTNNAMALAAFAPA